MNAKLYIGTVAAMIWVAALVGKHYWPDLDIGAIVLACGSVLSGLGVYHVSTMPEAQAADKQGGFARPVLLLLIALIAGCVAGCGTMTEQFENAITCTVAKDKGYAGSEWGPFLVGSKIRKADADVICK